MMKTRGICCALPLLLFLVASPARADLPVRLYFASPDDGGIFEEAVAAGAELLDRAPGLLVVGDEASAEALRSAGCRVEGPVATDGFAELLLLSPAGRRSETAAAALAAGRIEAAFGDDLLWTDGRHALVRLDGRAPFIADRLGLEGKSLRHEPIRETRSGREGDAPRPAATLYDPLIDDMVAQVDSADYMRWIGDLSGEQPVPVGGVPVTFWTRWSADPQCDSAEQYAYEAFQSMGYADVRYDSFSVLGQQSRNVIATLPGTETPDDIYIVVAHLDSRGVNMSSPAPGAVDNLSGSSVVLVSAAIMRSYEFRSTIRFVLVTGEEQGLFGSKRYAARAANAGDNILGVINNDMIAHYIDGYGIEIQGRPGLDWLMQEMADACAAYTGLSTQLSYSSERSDHVSFQDEGFAAIGNLMEDIDAYTCYHKGCDRIDQVHWDMGTDVTKATLAAIANLAEPVGVATGVLAGAGAPSASPAAVALLEEPRPNPFNPATTIAFRLDRPASVDLAVYDTAGRLVRRLLRGDAIGAGTHSATWRGEDDDGAAVASGVYFARMKAGRAQDVKRLILIR